MFCQSKKKKKDEEKGVYCPIAQKTIQPPKTGLGHFLNFSIEATVCTFPHTIFHNFESTSFIS